jgi:hypothetical protein
LICWFWWFWSDKEEVESYLLLVIRKARGIFQTLKHCYYELIKALRDERTTKSSKECLNNKRSEHYASDDEEDDVNTVDDQHRRRGGV